MASYSDWCEEQLLKLRNEDSRIPILREIKEFLTAMPREEMSSTATSLRLPAVFDCLNDTNSEQVDLACEVLSLCMNNLTLGESTNRYGSFLEKALSHPFAGVKLMALTEIQRNIKSDDILINLCKRESLLVNILTCLGDEEIEVAKMAADVIKIITLSTQGINQLTKRSLMKSWQDLLCLNEIARFRVYEIMVEIALQSDGNFNVVKSTGILIDLFNELKNNDVLLLLNVLEILSLLGKNKNGYEYIESNDIYAKIVAMLTADDQLSLQLTEPGILKFLGHMTYWKPLEMLHKHPTFYKRLFTNLDSSDYGILGVTLDTLGHVGLENEGKIALDSTEALFYDAFKSMVNALPSFPTDVKVRALNCIENLLTVKTANNQIYVLTEKWFNLIDESNPIDVIWNYAKNPFKETRLAGLSILNAIAAQNWGQHLINNTPGLIEFLLDRNIETTKECKEAKYAIVSLLATSDVFSQSVVKKFTTFVKEGPFYVQVYPPEVAVDGNE